MRDVGRLLIAWGGAYLLGSLPAGLFWAWIVGHIDVRQHGSGRTGGTNVWRSAGFPAALLTVVFDVLKGVAAIVLGHGLNIGMWGIAIAGTFAVIGHNYSIFMRFRGGAGTGTSVGVCSALWVLGLPILVGAGMIAGLMVGHASVASILVAVLLPVVFFVRGDLAYAIGFGLPTMALTLWALRPNIQRLIRGEERFLPIFGQRPPPVRISRHPVTGSKQ